MKNRVVAITGGSRGLGRRMAEMFLEKGDRVAVCARSLKPGDVPKAGLSSPIDVRNRQAMKAFADEVVEKLGGLDVLINCAGVSRWRPLDSIDEDFMKEIYETNVLGTLWGCQAAASAMKKGGVIINVSSLAGKRGSANNTAYCASKFAVNGITQALAKELGPRQIRVNAVCPVYVETPTILKSLEEPVSPVAGGDVRGYLDQFASTQTALKKLPTEQNVADAVFFLASPAASAITGQCVNVDCGTLPQ